LKVLLTTLNARYVHTNLAIRYIKKFCEKSFKDIKFREYTINDDERNIISDIYLADVDILGFSCYIWNIERTLNIIETLKKIKPEMIIVLGGPEVSYDSYELMKKYPFIDYIIYGEGEITFFELLDYLINRNGNISNIDGLVYRRGSKVFKNRERKLIDKLDILPFPYDVDELERLRNEKRIVYYESSRGCPFECTYCLSSTIKGVRYFDLNRVKMDLKKFIHSGIGLVKFVDRTFNCNKVRTAEILKFILDNSKKTSFHFEIGGDLLDDDILHLLSKMPPKLIQFEIGVQTTKKETLEIINRKMDFGRLKKAVKLISSYNNIHQHLDLIAGLPGETYDDIANSFNDVYELNTERIQLGFLKLLKGSGIRGNAYIYEYKFESRPPYEVLANNTLSFKDLARLKDIEDILEKYYNSHRFDIILKYLITYFPSPFKFFENFSIFWRQKGLFKVSHSLMDLYKILLEYFKENIKGDVEVFKEVIKFDFLSSNKDMPLPEYLRRDNSVLTKGKIREFFSKKENTEKYLPELSGFSIKDINKYVILEEFDFDILSFSLGENKSVIKSKQIYLFLYGGNQVLNRARVFRIPLQIF